jgi:hypothetical protein
MLSSMHNLMTVPGTSLPLVREHGLAGPLHCSATVTPAFLISGKLSTLGFVYVCVCVAHDFFRVSALRAAME